MLTSPIGPSLIPTYEIPSIPNKPNIQVRIAEIMAEIVHVLAQSSRNEREHIAAYKALIQELADKQADAKGAQGWIALSSGAISFGAALLPVVPLINQLGKAFVKAITGGILAVNETGTKYASTHFDVKEFQASSVRELLLREFDNLNNDIQSKSATRREFLEIVEKVLQIALSASRAS